jgi:GNAT superfamily N-acetyltransferase
LGLIPVPADHVGTVVTTLEMRVRPLLGPIPPSPLCLERWRAPDPARYRALFRRVGEPWLWYSRLTMDDSRLLAIVHDKRVEVFAVLDGAGAEVGLLELDLRHEGVTEISYFGLVPELAGRGHGRWLMARALDLAWRSGTGRIWLHTCTLDHPRALGFYRAQGFAATGRTLETFPDPRLAGILPRDAAPHIPLLGG